ncbi:hypothetical protein [Streptomyces sp. G1]|uniref:hypothetical protein n=1 Tax=Streptomyces sp. G1 TaxID=361572 RepID=UPI00202E4270|nr:hypothetical protein [Streptomyces sp. G1]MCM1971045.1 hypothetical protein [Streptomyces sp. G1]
MTEQNTTEVVPEPAEDTVPEMAAAQAVPVQAVPEQLSEGHAVASEVPAASKDRRKLFAALRWTSAVLIFGGVGTGVAYQVAQPERTDIPGLSTKADGRWTYPALAKPVLPAGAALPFGKDNPDGLHYAGLTQLILPPPIGSTPDPGLKREKDEVVSADAFLEEYDAGEHAKMKEQFANEGLRQIVGRGWTTPDGTRTRVYLLRYHASGFVDTFKGCSRDMKLNGAARTELDLDWNTAKSGQSSAMGSGVALYRESTPVGDEQVKVGCIQSGDIQAVILQTRKGEVASVPFHQTVILQHQLLR